MDSLTDGTASLLQYDNRRRQLDLLCVIGMHSSVRYEIVICDNTEPQTANALKSNTLTVTIKKIPVIYGQLSILFFDLTR